MTFQIKTKTEMAFEQLLEVLQEKFSYLEGVDSDFNLESHNIIPFNSQLNPPQIQNGQ